MKLFYCTECYSLIQVRVSHIYNCLCKKHAGKYLNDNLTAVFTKGTIIVGIDNNSFYPAVDRYKIHNPEGEKPYPTRIDFFFVGWVPTIPGEVIFVDTVDDVVNFPMDYDAGNEHSTMPNSQPKCNKLVCYCDNNGVCLNRKEWDNENTKS